MPWAGRWIALVLALFAAACGAGPTDSPDACPAAIITGVLEPLGMPGSIGIADGPRHLVVTWTGGFRAGEVDGTLVVLSPEGTIVGRVGDRVQMTGGEVRPGEWIACGAPRR